MFDEDDAASEEGVEASDTAEGKVKGVRAKATRAEETWCSDAQYIAGGRLHRMVRPVSIKTTFHIPITVVKGGTRVDIFKELGKQAIAIMSLRQCFRVDERRKCSC